MPLYRMGTGVVHIKLGGKAAKNPPKHCMAPHQHAGTERMGHCCAMSSFLCDHDMGEGLTCDMPLCAEHAVIVGKDRHLCPKHFAERKDPELF